MEFRFFFEPQRKKKNGWIKSKSVKSLAAGLKKIKIAGSSELRVSFKKSEIHCTEKQHHLSTEGKQAEQTLCPHSSNCTGYRSTSLHTGHWYFSAKGKINVTFVFSFGCCWLKEPGLERPLAGREPVGLGFLPDVKSYQYRKFLKQDHGTIHW